MVYLLSTSFNRSFLLDHLLRLLLKLQLSRLQRLLSQVNLLLLLLYIQALELEAIIYVTFFIDILRDVFELDLLEDFLWRFGSDSRGSTGLNDCEGVEDLLAPTKLDMIVTLDLLCDIVDADFMTCEMEEVRLLANVLLEVVFLLCKYIIQL